MTGFAGLDVDAFLRDHWQKRPLLIPGAFPGFKDPISAEELAGLALEDEVEARLVAQRGGRWELNQGPFSEQSFSLDPPWTLLVQSVDQFVPEVALLRSLIDFLPRWRIDDVMVSYATEGGGVGPHYDNYDVFLLQGQGQRRWQLGQACDASTPVDDSSGQKILTHFEPAAEYLVNPGDVLYVPPGVAHWGTATEPCITYSIGLRAPRVNDMLSRWFDALLEQVDGEQFYRDPELTQSSRPGELSETSIARALGLLQAAMAGKQLAPDWFGELVTEPKSDCWLPEGAEPPQRLALYPGAGLAWRETGQGLILYANGESFAAADSCLQLVQRLCGGAIVTLGELSTSEHGLVLELWHRGCLQDE